MDLALPVGFAKNVGNASVRRHSCSAQCLQGSQNFQPQRGHGGDLLTSGLRNIDLPLAHYAAALALRVLWVVRGHQHNAVSHQNGFVNIVRDQQRGGMPAVDHIHQQALHLGTRDGIQR